MAEVQPRAPKKGYTGKRSVICARGASSMADSPLDAMKPSYLEDRLELDGVIGEGGITSDLLRKRGYHVHMSVFQVETHPKHD